MTTSSCTTAPYAGHARISHTIVSYLRPEEGSPIQHEVAPYLAGQAGLAEMVVSYLGEEARVPAHRDFINAFFTSVDSHTASLSPQQVFWGLNNRWWMQIIDGRDHQHGPLVYDQGLHGGHVEPGFYQGIRSACEFVSAHLQARPTVSFYQQLHRTACAHFTGDRSAGMEMAAADAGFFRLDECICRATIASLEPAMTVAECEAISTTDAELRELETERRFWNRPSFQTYKAAALQRYGITEAEFLERSAAAPATRRALFQRFDEKIQRINSYIAERSRSLGASRPIAELVRDGTVLTVEYRCPQFEIETVVERLWAEFDGNIARATSTDERIRHIADLFQILEWLHPFKDGQGRTDLILLATLLCQHGINPAILQRPYVSTYWSLDEWVDYLKNGIDQWQREFSRNPLPAAAPAAGADAAATTRT